MPDERPKDQILNYKFSISAGAQHVVLPDVCNFVHVAEQNGVLTVWAVVPITTPMLRSRVFYVVGTGEPFPTGLEYVGTAQIGPFVWHLLEDTDDQ